MRGDFPLREAVADYLAKDPARFHMPGHKGYGEGEFATLLPWDITEVEGADSLYACDGPLLMLEQRLSALYRTKRSMLSAGGATLCIQTMLALACKPGGTVILSRNIHRAALATLALLDLQPVWIYPDESAGAWYLGRYTPQAVREALVAHPEAQAVYLTSPDYFGVISDIEGVANVCAAYGKPLLVDNAHGAHLPFLPEPYRHPIACGAALSADSLHKTMPAMTGAALLQIGAEEYLAEGKRMMALFGSSSPSYPILLSCERALVYGEQEAKVDCARVGERLEGLRRTAEEMGFALPQGCSDPLKLTLGFAAIGWERDAFGRHLRECGIEPEYLSETAAVLMANGFNREEDFMRVEAAVRGAYRAGGRARPAAGGSRLPRPARSMRPREATFAPGRETAVEESVGCVAAGEVTPCPPGIPIVMAGEWIDAETEQALASFGVRRVRVVDQTGG